MRSRLVSAKRSATFARCRRRKLSRIGQLAGLAACTSVTVSTTHLPCARHTRRLRCGPERNSLVPRPQPFCVMGTLLRSRSPSACADERYERYGSICSGRRSNAVGMGLAAGGLLHPIAAAILMVGSSMLVAFRSLRLCDEEDTPSAQPVRSWLPAEGTNLLADEQPPAETPSPATAR